LAVAGVVDEHPDRALGVLDRGHGVAHRFLVGDIQGQCAAAARGEVRDRV
jgi:hypothetical protein